MWIRLFLILLLAMGGWAVPALAVEDIVSGTLQNAATDAVDGDPLDVTGMSGVGLQVTITGTATVDFKTTVDGTTFNLTGCVSVADTTQTLVTATSVSGGYQCSISGMRQFRAPISSFDSGTVTVKGLATSAAARSRGGGGGLGAEVDTLQTVFARGKEITGANSFANARRTSDGTTTGWAEFVDATLGPKYVCYVLGVENDCNYFRSLNPGKSGGFQDRNGTEIFTITEAVGSGALTNVTLNVESSGNTITTNPKHNFATVGCSGTTGTLLLNTNATLAPTATCVAGSTNTTLIQGYADFPDSDGEYQGQPDPFRLPVDFTGAVDLQIYWKAAATSGDVVWQIASMCTSNAEIEDVAWNTASTVTDTALGTTLQLNTASITGLTMTNCVANDLLHLKFFRQRTHASDTITGVVSLKNVEMTMRRAQ